MMPLVPICLGLLISLVLFPLCASAGKAGREATELRGLQLFDESGVPHFVLYLGCKGKAEYEHRQCATVESAVDRWSAPLKVENRSVDVEVRLKDQSGLPAQARRLQRPGLAYYYLWLRFALSIEESISQFDRGAGGYRPPRVGYESWLEIIDAQTGALVHAQQRSEKKPVQHRANVTPHVREGIDDLLATIGPGG